MGVRFKTRRIRKGIKPFQLFALASLLIVLVTASLLQIAPSTRAQTVLHAQSQIEPVQIAQAPATPTASPASVVLDWNGIAQSTVLAASAPAPQQFRSLAIVHTAIFDAVNAIDRRYTPYAVDLKAPANASAEAAAATAGHAVLVSLYPAQKSALDTALTTSLAKIAEGQSKADGIAVGQQVAEKLIALRSSDGADQKIEYKAEDKIGVWQPTPPLFLPALLPQWNTVTPFVIKSANQFTVPAPLPLDSSAYAKDLNEVKRLGGRNSTVRTPEQTTAAIFSAISPVVLWNTTAQAAAKAKGNSLIENARLFALLNLAGVDAYIAGYDVKYKYKLWRPATAIPQADKLSNSEITPDPNWETLIVTPNHPDYISGHTVTAGAAGQILKAYFGQDAVNVNIIFPANAGVTRTFKSFSQIVDELVESRIWAGVHTRTANVQGAALGEQVGDYVFQNALRPIS
jgi:hypothetical protein